MIAVFGAGPIGGAIAQRLAERARVGDVLLIDENASVAAGKALDIRQSGPVTGTDANLSGTSDPLAAVGADVIVFADDTAGGPWDGDRGLKLIERLLRSGTNAPFVFAAPSQLPLMETAARELHVATNRMAGTSASAMAPIVASLVNIELGQTGTQVTVAGRPPAFVVGWSSATIGGSLVTDVVSAHKLLAISQSLSKLWPTGPQAAAAPTALVIEALVAGSRRMLDAVTILDGEYGVRGRAALLPLEIGQGRVLRRGSPSLSPQERNEMITKLTTNHN
jgi:malate dehydrogenase